MKILLKKISQELISSEFGLVFMLIGITIQLIASILNNDSTLSLISGISGVVSVVLCSQKKFSFYVFAWIQMITYAYLAYEQHLYGELTEYAFYAITTIYGMVVWFKYYNMRTGTVLTESLSKKNLFHTCVMTLAFIWVVYDILKVTNDSQPLLDSITTVPAFTAQILMVLRYKEQWLFWLIIDVASIVMWINAGNWCMAAQFVFWTANCIYGYNMWKKDSE